MFLIYRKLNPKLKPALDNIIVKSYIKVNDNCPEKFVRSLIVLKLLIND